MTVLGSLVLKLVVREQDQDLGIVTLLKDWRLQIVTGLSSRTISKLKAAIMVLAQFGLTGLLGPIVRHFVAMESIVAPGNVVLDL